MILRSLELKGNIQPAVEVSDWDESEFKLKVAESGETMVSFVDSDDNFFEVLSDQKMYDEKEEQMVPVVTEPKTGPKNDTTESETKGETKSEINGESTTTTSFCWWFKTMLFLVAIIMLMVPISWMAFAGVNEFQTITTTATDSNEVSA